MTEEQIERMVEHLYDRLDARLMSDVISQEAYDIEAQGIFDWAETQFECRE